MIPIEMGLRLRKLMQRHHIELPTSSIALAPPADPPMILEGLAATTDIDHRRMRLRALALVTRRSPASAQAEYYAHAIELVKSLGKFTELLQKAVASC